MKYEDIKEVTRRLRHNATPAEQKLWRFLRRKQLGGRKFLRQHAIIYETIGDEYYFYVPDFYCFQEKLAIELDGKIHFYTKEKDKRRDEILEAEGIKVLRFQNKELDEMEKVLDRIRCKFND